MIVNALLALASSVLLLLLFPGYSFSWLAPIALTPLLIACAREERWRARFAPGYGASAVFWFGLCNWIHFVLTHHGGVGEVAAWLVVILFCLAKAVQIGVFAALAGPVMNHSRFGIPGVAALWVAIEWTQWFGFEWLKLGNAGSDMAVLLRLAPVTGVWGISFAFALMSASIAAILTRRKRLASVWLLALAGLYLLPEIPAPEKGNRAAVIVQPNIDDETLWTDELEDRAQQQLARVSQSLAGNAGAHPPELIVWPEMPTPFSADDPKFSGLLGSVARATGASVITGAIGRTPRFTPLNSALLTGPDGARISRYDKVKLVPFGEFVPWPFGAMTQKISSGVGDFAAGDHVVVSPIPGHREGTFICYEAVFADYVRQFTAAGAEVLVNISNDSWFGKTQARYQHLRILRMRAAENRRWILRATNDGVSGVIDPAGRIVATEPEFREAAARLQFRYRTDLTFYARHGDWFVGLCWLVSALVVAEARAARRLRPGSLQ